MPYPNFHAARVRDPKLFTRILVLKKMPGGIMLYGGPLKTNPTGGSKPQSYRFPKSNYTVQQAKRWLADHNIKYILFEPSEDKKEFNINEPILKTMFGESNQFELASSAHIESNVPTQLFKKDLIQTGKYVHPIHKWVLDVTPERMDKWIASFNKMKNNGVDVEMVVDHRRDAEGVRGYVKDMFREGDVLYGITNMIGKESIDLVKTVKNVSILVDEEYKDGKENKYGESIAHVSIVQQPVAAGQTEFEVIQKAASRNDENIVNKYPIYYFNKGDMNMDVLSQIKKTLEIQEDIDENNVVDIISKHFKKLSETEKAGLTTKITELESSIEKMKKDFEKKPEDKKPEEKINPNLAEQMGKTAEQRVTNLVAAGKLTPAARDLVVKNFIGDKGERKLKALSIGDDGISSLDSLIEVLETNDPVELGEKTNTFAMSRQIPGKQEEYDPAVTKEMIEQGSISED